MHTKRVLNLICIRVRIAVVSSKPSSLKWVSPIEKTKLRRKLNMKKTTFTDASKSTQHIVTGALIAALYTVLTYATSFIPTIGGVFQFRIAEALTILPYFTAAAIPGLGVGCLLANILTGAGIYDIIFGTLATLIGAIGTRLLKKNKWLAPLPPILANTIIMPFVIAYLSNAPESIPFFAFSVGLGELVCCGLFGMLLLFALEKRGIF